MDVTGSHSDVYEVCVQLFGHALGQRGNQHPLALIDRIFNLVQQIINLIGGGTHFNRRVQKSCGPHHLLDHYPTRLLQFIVRRGGAHVDGLPYQRLKLVELERTVIQGRRQPKTVLHEVDFAGTVAAIHGPDLWHRNVTFVNHQHKIVGEKVEDAERAHSRCALVEITRIVLNAGAVTQLFHHLHIVRHAIFQPFGFQMLADRFQVIALLAQVQYNLVDGLVHALLGGHEKAGRINHNLLLLGDYPTRFRFDNRQGFNLIVPKDNAEGVFAVGRENIDRVAFHAELSGLQIELGTRIETGHELQQQRVTVNKHPRVQMDDVLGEIVRIADTVNTRYRGHYNHIPPSRH